MSVAIRPRCLAFHLPIFPMDNADALPTIVRTLTQRYPRNSSAVCSRSKQTRQTVWRCTNMRKYTGTGRIRITFDFFLIGIGILSSDPGVLALTERFVKLRAATTIGGFQARTITGYMKCFLQDLKAFQ